jgi:hypothetical protein
LKTINVVQNLSRYAAIVVNPHRCLSIFACLTKLKVRQVSCCQVGQNVDIGWSQVEKKVIGIGMESLLAESKPHLAEHNVALCPWYSLVF